MVMLITGYVLLPFPGLAVVLVLMVIQVWTAGQVIGLIHDIPTCAQLLTRIEKEAVQSMERTQSLYNGSQSKL